MNYINYLLYGIPSTSKINYNFQIQYPLNLRKEEATKIRNKYPTKIPIIIEKSEPSNTPILKKEKYLIEEDITVGGFIYCLREQMCLDSEFVLYLFINGVYPPKTKEKMRDIYTIYKEKDEFLYITYKVLDH